MSSFTFQRAATATIAALVSLGLSGQVLASGFQVREQSGSALGNAFAGVTAGVDDPSFMFYNPASMTYLDGTQGSAAFSYIVPSSRFEDGSASTIAGVPITPTAAFNGDNNISEDALVPALYGMTSFGEDIRLGIGLSLPFGLSTSAQDGWIGRYHALDSELRAILINPSGAYRVTDWLSVGAGLQVIYGDTKLTQSIDIGSIGAASGIPGSAPTMQDGHGEIDGDDWGYGYNVGLMLQPLDALRVGFSYRSKVSLEATGDATFDLSGSGTTGAALQSAGLFTNTGFNAELDLPEQISVGVDYAVNDKLSLLGEASWTRWSRFENLVINFDNPAQPTSFTEEDWEDTWFFALGATYRPVDYFAMRFGVAHDQTPVPDRTRTPRVPDEDRYWMAFGAEYEPASWLTFNLSYTHIFLPDASINLSATDPGNTFRGNLNGEFVSSIDIIALQGTVRF